VEDELTPDRSPEVDVVCTTGDVETVNIAEDLAVLEGMITAVVSLAIGLVGTIRVDVTYSSVTGYLVVARAIVTVVVRVE